MSELLTKNLITTNFDFDISLNCFKNNGLTKNFTEIIVVGEAYVKNYPKNLFGLFE